MRVRSAVDHLWGLRRHAGYGQLSLQQPARLTRIGYIHPMDKSWIPGNYRLLTDPDSHGEPVFMEAEIVLVHAS